MTETATEKALRPWYTRPRNIIIMLAALVLLILALQNMSSVKINILSWEARIPATLVYITFAIVGYSAGRFTRRSQKS